MPSHIASVDLGASSGRVITGTLLDGRIELKEARRFTNGPIPLPSRDGERLYWDILYLWNEVREGLLAAYRDTRSLDAVGIDTWAVDYGLLDAHGALKGQIASYRSPRTRGIPERVFSAIPAADMYAINGLQVQDFNTVFQLVAEHEADGLNGASTLLLLPDLLTYWLTGNAVAEISNASTTGLVDARSRNWSPTLLDRLRAGLGVDVAGILPRIVEAGEVVGTIDSDVVDVRGPNGTATPVVAVGTHDTASAVVAVPAQEEDFAYISCGTWSLVGLELDQPFLTEDSRKANFTNELGVDGTVRYLKNIMGLWVFNEAVRTWRSKGMDVSYEYLNRAAAAAEPLRTVVDLNDDVFFTPGDMPSRIDAVARATGQPVPNDIGAYVRCIDDSLALAYRRAIREAAELADRTVSVVHIVGGGIRNELLCQLAADAIGLPVVAGPAEGTALGNTVVAARGAGLIDGDLGALRRIVRASSELVTYTPDRSAAETWADAEARLS